MSNKNHTWDGSTITGSVTGFTEYSTERITASSVPAPVLSPSDLLGQIADLRRFLNLPDLQQAITMLADHMSDTSNPHQTDLDAFTDQVIDVLYKAYTDAGGEASSSSFSASLFKVLHIATSAEMDSGTDSTALLSVAGCRNYLHAHEVDTDAHKELLDAMFPGRPVTTNPVYALYANVGISSDITTKLTDKEHSCGYTYIGVDRKVHTCADTSTLPIDYSYTEPMIPCFGYRTNSITNSCDFSTLTASHVRVASGIGDPAGGTSASSISVPSLEIDYYQHSVTIEDFALPMKTHKTVSVFVKAGTCPYFMISYKDMTSSIVVVRAIFNLTDGSMLMMNHMDRYNGEIIALADGWYRVSLTMYHPIGQSNDLDFTFFASRSANQQDFTFRSEAGTLGYMFGLQCEDGPNLSPYIPTSGTAVTRTPISIRIPLSDWWTPNNATTVCSYKNPKLAQQISTRPIFSIINSSGTYASEVNLRPTGIVEIMRWATLTVDTLSTSTLMYDWLFSAQNDLYCHVTQGIGTDGYITSAYNSTIQRETTPKLWDAGSTLYVGNNIDNKFLEGYLRKITIYPVSISEDEATFLNGEEVR